MSTRLVPSDRAALASQLAYIQRKREAAERRGAHYAECYGLIELENQWREALFALGEDCASAPGPARPSGG